MCYLNGEDVLFLHYKLIEDYGGSHGIRDENRVASVIGAPKQQTFGEYQYPGVFEKAAVYARNIIAVHPFVDGNKRTGITCAAIFLMKNGYALTAEQKVLEDFAVQIAVENCSIEEIAACLKAHSMRS